VPVMKMIRVWPVRFTAWSLSQINPVGHAECQIRSQAGTGTGGRTLGCKDLVQVPLHVGHRWVALGLRRAITYQSSEMTVVIDLIWPIA